MDDRLRRAVEERAGDLVGLTADLIRFPTVNPPGEAYGPCAEFVGARLARHGYETLFVRGEGAPGDSDRYPRINVVARANTCMLVTRSDCRVSIVTARARGPSTAMQEIGRAHV